MLWIIAAGPMPTHIAFIMDGNRRFADRLRVDRRIGHSHGYDALLRTLKDCFDLNIRTVTLFAFSIDNFHRSSDEVSALMDLMQSKLEALVEKQGLASQYGIKIRVLGDLHLLPQGARLAAEKAMAVTSQNSSLILNLCVSYTSTHEIVKSIQKTRDDFLAVWSASYKACSHTLCSNLESSHRNENDVINGCTALPNDVCVVQCTEIEFEQISKPDYGNGCHYHKVDGIVDAINTGHANGNQFSKVCDNGRMSGAGDCDGEKLSSHLSIGLRNRCQNKVRTLDDSMVEDSQLDEACISQRHICLCQNVHEIRSNGREYKASLTNNGSTVTGQVISEMDCYGSEKNNGVLDTFKADSNTSQCFSVKHYHPLHELHVMDPCYNKDSKFVSAMHSELVGKVSEAVKDHISEEEIEKNMYTYPCPPPDLLIRTSGETRLSNFLLWQTSFSYLAFCKVLWPEFSFRHLFLIILEYQRAFSSLAKKQQRYNSKPCKHC
ncbi:hypothetical protein KP509_16G044700 [Ceratopteris richardii]|nr:hypothetical protein KP509_16G044700 [Ceratopteris richardii]